MEVAAALAQSMPVIPLLLDRAAMPAATQLPEALQPLVRRNALAIDNTRFAAAMDRLVAALREALGESAGALANAPPPAAPSALPGARPSLADASTGLPPAPSASRSRVALAAGVAGGLLLAGGLARWWPQRMPPATDRRARPDINGMTRRRDLRLAERALHRALRVQWRGGRPSLRCGGRGLYRTPS